MDVIRWSWLDAFHFIIYSVPLLIPLLRGIQRIPRQQRLILLVYLRLLRLLSLPELLYHPKSLYHPQRWALYLWFIALAGDAYKR